MKVYFNRCLYIFSRKISSYRLFTFDDKRHFIRVSSDVCFHKSRKQYRNIFKNIFTNFFFYFKANLFFIKLWRVYQIFLIFILMFTLTYDVVIFSTGRSELTFILLDAIFLGMLIFILIPSKSFYKIIASRSRNLLFICCPSFSKALGNNQRARD